MFRKITHIVLSVFLLVATTGISLSLHYCSGEFVSSSINKEAKSCCNGTGGCCENKSIHLEIEDDYFSSVVVDNPTIDEIGVLFPILNVLSSEFELAVRENIDYITVSWSPPKIQTRLSLLQTYLC